MSDFFLLSEAQMRRIKPYFPLSHGIARVDDRMVISSTNATTDQLVASCHTLTLT